MKNEICLTLPLDGEYMTTVRLTTGGVCSLAGVDVDATEDCKVCVTESLLLLKRNGYAGACVRLTKGDRLFVFVEGLERTGKAEDEEDEISKALLSALVDDLTISREGGKASAFSFSFRLA